jgi:chaperonin GroES
VVSDQWVVVSLVRLATDHDPLITPFKYTHEFGEIDMAIRPLDDRVLVEPLEAEEKTAGGILLPDTAKEKPQRGKVVAAGPGKLRDSGDRTALSVKVGDEVLFGRYAGSEVKEGGKEYKVMRESDILAKVVS